eukprot:8105446-Pyramimonas_sp.AAC.1
MRADTSSQRRCCSTPLTRKKRAALAIIQALRMHRPIHATVSSSSSSSPPPSSSSPPPPPPSSSSSSSSS